MSALTIFRDIAEEFAGIADEKVERIIALAANEVAPDLCGGGERREEILAYLAAHKLTLAKRKLGASGNIQNMTEGRLSIGYGGANLKTSLSSTSYGQEYDRLSKACIFSARTRGPCAVTAGIWGGCGYFR